MKTKIFMTAAALAASASVIFAQAAPSGHATTAATSTTAGSSTPNAQSGTSQPSAIQSGKPVSAIPAAPGSTSSTTITTPGGQPITPGSAITPGQTINPGSAIQPGQTTTPGSAITPGQPVNPGSAIQTGQPNLPAGVGTQQSATAQFEAQHAAVGQQIQNQQSQINGQFGSPNARMTNGTGVGGNGAPVLTNGSSFYNNHTVITNQ